MNKKIIKVLLAALLLASCSGSVTSSEAIVEVREEEGKTVLYRNGLPYYIKGAAGTDQLEKVAHYGGNSVRTWNTREAGEILDEAERLGLSVTLGLEVGKEWWGEDFNFWNPFAVNEKTEELKEVINRYKDHPALLMWGVGNEVHLFGGNQLLVLHTIDKIAKMIHETDPNHPVMTTVPLGPNFEKRGIMRLICPNIDILGVNGFQRLPQLHGSIRDPFGWNKAYLLSEWGPPGPWETSTTEWGAPLEEHSTRKAEMIRENWEIIQKDSTLCLGGYAFYWGSKYERTHTFYSLFTPEGMETASVNELQKIWSGKPSPYLAPKIDSLVINDVSQKENIYLPADSVFSAAIYVQDPENGPLDYQWEIRPEGKDNFEPGNFNQNMDYLFISKEGAQVKFNTPAQEGAYRLISYVTDSTGQSSTHNIPVYVKLYK